MSDGYSDYTYNYQNPYAAYRPQVQQQQQGPSAGQQVAGQAARTGAGVAGRSIASSLAGGGTAAAGGAAATGGAAAGGGTIVVANAAAVPAGYTAIGTAASGGVMAVPTATIAGSGAAAGATGAGAAGAAGASGTGAAGGAAGMGAGTMAGVGAAAAMAAYLGGRGIHEIVNKESPHYKDWNKDKAGVASRATAAYLTYGGSELARKLGVFGGKGKDERNRDSYRDALRESGFLDENYTRQGEGGSFAFGDSMSGAGKDGSDFGFNLEVDEQGNLSNEDQRMMAGSIDPLAAIFSRGNEKQQSDMSGEITNSILGTGGGRDDVRALYESMGINRETATQELSKLLEQDKIDEGKFNAYLAAIDRTLD